MKVKCLKFILLLFLFSSFGVSPASATAVLFDWYIDVNGTVYEVYPEFYQAPEVDGEITVVTGFADYLDGYGDYVPEADGGVTVSFNPGVASDYYVKGYFDTEIDEFANTFYNEFGASHGVASGGIYGYVDDWDGDISFTMGWDFTLAVDETAIITFLLGYYEPDSPFYLSQTDPDSDETIYLSSALDIQSGGPAPVPEPATLLLMATGLAGLFGLRKRRFLITL